MKMKNDQLNAYKVNNYSYCLSDISIMFIEEIGFYQTNL